MARIRTVKPEIWTSEQFCACSRDARLLFIGLFNFSDCGGVHKLSPGRIKSEVFPDDDDIDQPKVRRMLDELVNNGLIGIFESQGSDYIHILTFKNHQKIDHPAYKHPAPPKNPAGYKEWSPKDQRATADLFGGASAVTRHGRDVEVDIEGNRIEAAAPLTPLHEQKATAQPSGERRDDHLVAVTDDIWAMAGQAHVSDQKRFAGNIDDFRHVRRWREAGYTDDEIRTAARAIIDGAGEISNLWSLLAKAMPDRIGRARKPPPRADVADTFDPDSDRKHWYAFAVVYFRTGRWRGKGPPPDQANTLCPADVLAEVKSRPEFNVPQAKAN